MTIKKLTSMPYAQAHARIYDDGTIVLVSYSTVVCIIHCGGWFECTGLYSATTRKHIGAFVKEYIVYPDGTRATYQLAKNCVTKNYRFNIETGEIEHLI